MPATSVDHRTQAGSAAGVGQREQREPDQRGASAITTQPPVASAYVTVGTRPRACRRSP